MNESNVRVGFGSYTFKNFSGSLAAYSVGVDKGKIFATYASKAYPAFGSPVNLPLSFRPEINGVMCQTTLTVPEGAVLSFVARRRTMARPFADGAFFVRIRKEGPLHSVNLVLPNAQEMLSGARVSAFYGNGDLLTAEDVRNLGYPLDVQYENRYMDEEEIRDCFDFEVVHPGKTPSVEISTVTGIDGKSVTVTVERKARRMRIRKT